MFRFLMPVGAHRAAVGGTLLLKALLAVLTAITVALASAPAPASAQNVRVGHTLFGAHDLSGASYSRIHEGAIRIWDPTVWWASIETTQGHYDWTRLDALVSAAQAAHAEVTFTVGITPRWYASKGTNPPRTLAPYQRFVTALMKRYKSFHGKRGIAAYQVWNEVNISTFYTGTLAKMAQMTRTMAQVRNAVDPHAKVIAPSMVTRLTYQQKAISSFYRQRVGGVPVWKYVDATGFSLYPMDRIGGHAGVPEDSMNLLHKVRGLLHRAGVPASKPLWNTEINYGLKSGSAAQTGATKISDATQASNVIRTYLLNAANGVKRVFWFRYDMPRQASGGTIGNTLLSDPANPLSVSAAGQAYVRAQQWMHGTLIGPSRGAAPCQKDRQGTYTCIVRDSSGTRRIYWNPFRSATVRLPSGVHHLQGVLGATSSVRPGAVLKVNANPVMVSR